MYVYIFRWSTVCSATVTVTVTILLYSTLYTGVGRLG